MDDALRTLERQARASGLAVDWTRYLETCRDPVRTRAICYGLLAESPSLAREPALQILTENGGVWLEEIAGSLSVYGVISPLPNFPFSQVTQVILGDVTTVPYQRTGFCEEGPLDFRRPTIGHVDSVVRAIDTALTHDRQPVLAERIRSILRDDLASGICTSSAVRTNMNLQITHYLSDGDYAPDSRVPVRLTGEVGIPDAICTRTLFETDDTPDQVAARYQRVMAIQSISRDFRTHVFPSEFQDHRLALRIEGHNLRVALAHGVRQTRHYGLLGRGFVPK